MVEPTRMIKSTFSRTVADGVRTSLSRFAVPLIALVLFATYSFVIPDIFFTWGNVRAMLNSQAIVLLLALATTIPVRAGDLDFSPAAVMTGSGATLAASFAAGVPWQLAVLLSLCFGLAVGAIHAFFIVKLGVDAFVMTLGSLIALGGYAYLVTGSRVLVDVPQEIIAFATTPLFGLPSATWYGWVLIFVVWYVYEKTPVGRYLLFTGGSRDAARLAGVRAGLVRTLALFSSALICSFAGVVLVGQFASLDPSIGPSYLLQPATAVFLGATTIQVGRYNAWGTVFALYLLVIGVTGLQLLGATQWLNSVFNGVALVIAITVARIAQMRHGS